MATPSPDKLFCFFSKCQHICIFKTQQNVENNKPAQKLTTTKVPNKTQSRVSTKKDHFTKIRLRLVPQRNFENTSLRCSKTLQKQTEKERFPKMARTMVRKAQTVEIGNTRRFSLQIDAEAKIYETMVVFSPGKPANAAKGTHCC